MVRRASGGALFEPAAEKRDREVTLGPGMLAILGIGLLTLCGVCFVFGYGVGHRSSPQTSLQQATSLAPSLGASSQAKPSASANGFQSPVAPAPDSVNEVPANPDGQNPAADAAAPATSTAAPAARPDSVTPPAAVVQTALPASGASGQPIAPNGVVHPALAPSAGNWMVQIAAVSQSEDADVLVSALRKRGYAVSVRRDPVDNLMHVQVGPFTVRTDAAAMRQRLLNDGYNAIIEP